MVVSGIIKSGTVKVNHDYLLGPNEDNTFKIVSVKSIHFNRVPVSKANPGYFCCLAIKSKNKKEPI